MEARDVSAVSANRRTDRRTDELTTNNALQLLTPDETLTFSSGRRHVVNVPAEPMIRTSDVYDELLSVMLYRRRHRAFSHP